MKIPEELYYTEDHEWGKVEEDTIRVGITDYAQQELGDIVFIDLVGVGTSVARGESLGTVESVKAVSEIYAPVDGEVIEINEALADDPGLVNQDPYEQAWLVVMRMDDPSQAGRLMDSDAYELYVKSEAK